MFTCVGPDGRPLGPKTCFDLFEEFHIRALTKEERKEGKRSEQMYHVLFELFDIKELEKRVANIRNRQDTEGSVLYLCDSDVNALAFVKVYSAPLTLVLVLTDDESPNPFLNPISRSKVVTTLSTGECERY